MFGLTKTNAVLGIDIGATSVKIVELKSAGGKPVLVNYAYSESSPANLAQANQQINTAAIADIIIKLCAKAEITTDRAVAAMPSFSVFTSVLHIANPGKKPEELQAAVLWEAKKVVPLALEEMMLDWQKVEDTTVPSSMPPASTKKQNTTKAPPKSNTSSAPAGGINVLLTGAPKNLVKKYIDIFKAANLHLVSLETEMFSLIRSLIGSNPAVIALVDLGAVNTDIAIVENGLPLFTRSLDVGGIMVTRAIASALQVDFKRAEQFKFDLGMVGTTDQAPDKGDMPPVIKNTLAPIINEIRYSLNLFQQENNKKIDKVVLAGGGAGLIGLSPYLSAVLGINVVIGDPWARISYPENLTAVLEEISFRMAIAAGLALREVVS